MQISSLWDSMGSWNPTQPGSFSTVTSETVSKSTVSTSTVPVTESTESLPGGYSWPGSLTVPTSNTLVQSYPSGTNPTDECGKWVGIEVIVMVDVVEICPDGQTSTTTSTETYEIMTRSICHTSMQSMPCYVCEFGLPTGMHLMTVSTTSNTASPDPTPAVTVQACSTCDTSVFKTSVLGFTPGAECYGCQPSSIDGPVASMTLENHELETVSLVGASSLDGVTGDGASNPVAGSVPSGNTPSPPPSASATYLTAGSSRNAVHAGLIGLIVGVVMITW
ncbi:hypothetical protein N8I77_003838 [Diaporthe amygdali]|uniref:Uncharacterized protein n=1 Tax=Phomopsis amygdali TaxID=1214568 RepID=A0AAD9W824_PHOAM|nr:hypothetical protein N8I77_003838 [Diaporthe amygdali]